MLGVEPVPNAAGPRYLFEADPDLGVRLRPGFAGRHEGREFDVAVEINAHGFRDDELGAKRDRELRVLSLSDSFGYGFGVAAEETYSEVLEKRLRARFPGRPRHSTTSASSDSATRS